MHAAPPLEEGRIAVLLSRNARGVSEKTISAARETLSSDDVFVTASLEEAAVAARAIVNRGYSIVVSGGGDGTLSAAVTQICAARRACGEARPLEGMPRFVVLPLGTGNAVARYVIGPRYRKWKGARGVRNALRTLSSLREDNLREISVPALRVDNGTTLCFLGGCGFDSFILDDYRRLRRLVSRVPILNAVLSSVFGYFFATSISTLPQYALGNRRANVRVTAPSSGSVAYVDPRRGDAALPIVSSSSPRCCTSSNSSALLLYEGSATIVAAGATPYYGGGMRLFPFARSTERASAVNLRVARMSPWRFVPNAFGIFAGTYRSPADAIDFIGSEFSIEIIPDDRHPDGIPVQHSGDALGNRKRFDLSVAGPVKFVDLLGLPPAIGHLAVSACDASSVIECEDSSPI